MFERRLYHHIDWALVIAILALCALGVLMINSTTADPTRSMSRMYITQLYAIVLGLGAMVFMLTLDYRTFTDKSHLIYIGLCALLLYVLFFGMVQMGARRWIPLRIFNLQPSEFAKVGVALVLAKFFGENRGAPAWTDLFVGGALTLIPFALIAKEPDLGTAVTLLPVFLAVAYLAGMRMRILGVLFLCCLLGARRVEVCAQGLSEDPDFDVPRSVAGCERRRLPADPGAHHRRVWGAPGQRIQEGDAGPIAVPAGRPQRFHFLGAGRGARVCRRPSGARLVSVRDFAHARGGPARQGSPRLVSRTRRPRQFHLPGGLQHHHVGRTGAGQRTHAPAHELWGVVDDRDTRWLRAGAERTHAQIHELTGSPEGLRYEYS